MRPASNMKVSKLILDAQSKHATPSQWKKTRRRKMPFLEILPLTGLEVKTTSFLSESTLIGSPSLQYCLRPVAHKCALRLSSIDGAAMTKETKTKKPPWGWTQSKPSKVPVNHHFKSKHRPAMRCKNFVSACKTLATLNLKWNWRRAKK